MARLYDARNIAWSSTGTLLAGARLYTFDSVSITTPKATYSDNGLTTSNGSYVQADASGVFPPIYGTANEAYYCVLKDSAGNTIDEIPDVVMLGTDASTSFLKDLGVNGRFMVSGSAGVVQVETGNASGDDVGGSGRIGGYAGTQGDALEIDYAATSFTGSASVTGAVTATGAGTFGGNGTFTGGGLTLGTVSNAVPRCTVRSSASAAVSTDIALDTAFEEWEIRLRNVTVSSGGVIKVRFSFDNGATFKTGAAEYIWSGVEQATSTATGTSSGIQVGASTTATTTQVSDIMIRVTSKAGRETRVWSEYVQNNTAGTTGRVVGFGGGTTNALAAGKATHIRIYESGGGAITCDYVVIGYP